MMSALLNFPAWIPVPAVRPHVRRTGEIRLLKKSSAARITKAVYASASLCGFRALALLNHEHEILMKTANYLTTSSDEIYGLTVKMKTENAALRASLKRRYQRTCLKKIHAVSEVKEISAF